MAWTEERRQRQRELILRVKPWEKSTGPRTAEGKAKSAQNSKGLKPGHKISIREWKPWEQSTGPKTKMGKAKSAQNALRHGLYSQEMIEIQSLLTELARERRQILKNFFS